tara:strand:- start:1702 stop:2751 length:1050 start_codon:yes stop_codon:yes gene_type:complete
MKFFKSIIIILVIFLKTGNVLSNEDIFHVNNIELIKKTNISSEEMTNRAIKKGFEQLKKKILLNKDLKKLSDLNLSQIKELVSFYQMQSINEDSIKQNTVKYNISFDKDKLHILFYNKNISYSEILNKEIFLLPIFLQNEKIYIYNNNYFYENWNLNYESKLIEFILPLENIEILQTINLNKDNLLDLNLKDLFPEYKNKNLAVIIIEDTNSILEKIFIKTIIMGKNIDKNIQVKRLDNNQQNEFYQKIINEINSELISLVKSQNLIDVKTPSFLNTKFLNRKNYNLVELNKRIEKIDLIDRVFVQEFNNDYVMLKIKYLGKLEKVIQQLKEQSVILELIGDEWRIKIT